MEKKKTLEQKQIKTVGGTEQWNNGLDMYPLLHHYHYHHQPPLYFVCFTTDQSTSQSRLFHVIHFAWLLLPLAVPLSTSVR